MRREFSTFTIVLNGENYNSVLVCSDTAAEQTGTQLIVRLPPPPPPHMWRIRAILTIPWLISVQVNVF